MRMNFIVMQGSLARIKKVKNAGCEKMHTNVPMRCELQVLTKI
jgi:hypothetical protein